jgi:hypothetical protein
LEAKDVRELFENVLPRDVIVEAVRRLGVQQRERAFDAPAMVMALVMLGGTAEAGRIGAAVREYFQAGHSKVARSAYYRWFDAEFLKLMEELSDRARAYVSKMPLHLPGVLAGRKDWRAVDSTTVRLHDSLRDTYPGTGEYAALKVHLELSLGSENVVGYKITPARQHDAPSLVVDERLRGMGLIVDLGYVSHSLLRRCAEFDVHLVARLKEGWKVYLDTHVLAREVGDWTFDESMEACFEGDSLPAELSGPLDVDVRLGAPGSEVRARLVNVETPEGYRAFLTTVPRATHDAEAIAYLYRLRWTIELHNKLAKSGCQLDEIQARRPVSVEILVHASIIASMLGCALVHLEHLSQGMVGSQVVKPKRPPHHAILVWKCLVVAAWRISDLLANPEAGQRLGWEHIASTLTHGGQDPNWRSRPSAMDDAKGRNAAGLAWWKSRVSEKSRKSRAAAK